MGSSIRSTVAELTLEEQIARAERWIIIQDDAAAQAAKRAEELRATLADLRRQLAERDALADADAAYLPAALPV